jgi:hypothetical protein
MTKVREVASSHSYAHKKQAKGRQMGRRGVMLLCLTYYSAEALPAFRPLVDGRI